jgi:hypothetical protein
LKRALVTSLRQQAIDKYKRPIASCLEIPCMILSAKSKSTCTSKKLSQLNSLALELPRDCSERTLACLRSAIEANTSSCFIDLAICIEPIHEVPSTLRRDCICTARKWNNPRIRPAAPIRLAEPKMPCTTRFLLRLVSLMQSTRWASSRASCAACIRAVHASK